MSKSASISVPGGRRVARAALVSVLLVAAGSALGADDGRPAGGGRGQQSGARIGAGNASGLARMMGSATRSNGSSRSAGGGDGGQAAPSGASRMVSSGRG